MHETRRFLRYVLPGLLFAVEAAVIQIVLHEGWIRRQLEAANMEKDVGPAIGILLASGGLGFLFSTVHHFAHWHLPWYAADHRSMLRLLVEGGYLQLRDARAGGKQYVEADVFRLTRQDAWVITAALWAERLETSLRIRGANARAESLSDLMHAAGTARVASVTVALVSVVAGINEQLNSRYPPGTIRLIAAAVLLGTFVMLHHGSYKELGNLTQRLVDQVLTDALIIEKEVVVAKSTVQSN